MSAFEFEFGSVENSEEENLIQILDQDEEDDKEKDKDNGRGFNAVQLVDERTAVYKNGNCENENEDQEEKIPVALENMRNSSQKFGFESETKADREKEKREIRNKRVKIAGILVLCFLLCSFVLAVILTNRTSKSLSSTPDFSAAKMEALEKENRQLKKSQQELKEQFETQSQKCQAQSKNSSGQDVSFLTPPESRRPPTENQNPDPVDQQSLQSCSHAMEALPSPRSKKQIIYPHGNSKSLQVLCDFETDGGGWTIIQKRIRGPKEDFAQNWTKYTQGFGSLDGNFWIGLENIRALTQNGDQELRIELEDFVGEERWTKYSSFSISDASDFYRLEIRGFFENSTAGDSFLNAGESGWLHHGMRFTTEDRDNDNAPWGNCGKWYNSGWWVSRDWDFYNRKRLVLISRIFEYSERKWREYLLMTPFFVVRACF